MNSGSRLVTDYDDDRDEDADVVAADGPPRTGRISVDIPADSSGVRIDKVLSGLVPELSRARAQALIKSGAVSVDGTAVSDTKTPVREGAVLTLDLPDLEDPVPRGEAIPLDVRYEDDALIVIDKPAGMVVHPSAGHETGTLVNALIAHCGESLSGIGGVRRPGIVHRLDRDTSGLLVVAKTDRAHQGLSEQFAAHGRDGRLVRTYRALVWDGFDRPYGTVDAPVGRSETNRLKMAVVSAARGREAVTHFRVVGVHNAEHGPVVSELAVELETGRTHQIRVHLAHIRHPVVGDPVYASAFRTRHAKLPDAAQIAVEALGRQALHAERLGFEHPLTGEALCFESGLPADMQRVIDALA
jgi:23S rRNA pseudouridine1911/1915/1917 synthase